MIYHLARAGDVEVARAGGGSYRISSAGRTLDDEGFVHACYADQLAGVAQRYYAEVGEALVLLCIDEATLACPVRVEAGFPHIYGPIELAAVTRVVPLTRGPDGRLQLPALLA